MSPGGRERWAWVKGSALASAFVCAVHRALVWGIEVSGVETEKAREAVRESVRVQYKKLLSLAHDPSHVAQRSMLSQAAMDEVHASQVPRVSGASVCERRLIGTELAALLIALIIALFIYLNFREHWRPRQKKHSEHEHALAPENGAADLQYNSQRNQQLHAEVHAGSGEQVHERQQQTWQNHQKKQDDSANAERQWYYRSEATAESAHGNATLQDDMSKGDEEVEVSEATPSGNNRKRRTKRRRDLTENEVASRPRTRRLAALEEHES